VANTSRTTPAQNESGNGSTSSSAKNTTSGDQRSNSYVVKKGDTLYGIALENGLDYKEIAAWNQLADVNLIKVDQTLRLTPPDEDKTAAGSTGVVMRPLAAENPPLTKSADAAKGGEVVIYPKALKLSYNTDAATVARLADGPLKAAEPVRPVETKPVEVKPAEIKPAEVKPAEVKPVDPAGKPPVVNPATGDEEVAAWGWPSTGKVITPFSDASKGIDIGGKVGQPVLAAAGGKVVYAGSGLRGYGKLVIIKHNKTFLSAYAHNSQLLVKEGDAIKKGDKIAEMGSSDAEQVKLHFEIRRFGKPVDPNKYLAADKL